METESKSNKKDLTKTEIVKTEEKTVSLKKQPKRFSNWSFRNFWNYLKENTKPGPRGLSNPSLSDLITDPQYMYHPINIHNTNRTHHHTYHSVDIHRTNHHY